MGCLAVRFEANKKVFNVLGNSTSSQILEDEQEAKGLSDVNKIQRLSSVITLKLNNSTTNQRALIM